MELTSYQFRHIARFRRAYRQPIATDVTAIALDRRGEKMLIAASLR